MVRETINDKFTELRKRTQRFLTLNAEDVVLSHEEIMKLLYELDTYQVKLEQQNEHLRSAQQELFESRDRYKNLYDFSPIGLLTISNKGLIFEANLTAEEMLDVERKFLIKQPFYAFIFSEDQDIYNHYIKILVETKNPQAFELRMQKKDGSVFHAYLKSTSINSIDGDHGQFQISIINISQHRQDEDKLKEIGQQYRTVTDHTYDWEFWIDPGGNFVYVSPSCEIITGYHPDEFHNKPHLFEEIIHPDDRHLYLEHRCEITDANEIHYIDFRIITRSGVQRWIGHNCRAVYDDAGNVLGRRGSNRDISELKKTETTLQRIKERYRTIVMDQYDLICRFDPKGRLTFVNDAYCECFSVKYNEILGTNFLPNIYKKDLPLVINHFKFLSPQQPKKTIEYRVILADGKIRWQQWTGRALFNEKNEIIEYQAVGRDITDLKETEVALRNAGAELEQRVKKRTIELKKTHEQLLHADKLSAIGSLSASIAHEFNNPLQGVITILKGIKQYAALEKNNEKLVGLAIKECYRMKDLIASLQDFNRPTSGKMTPVDIHANIDALLLINKKDLKKRQIIVEKEYTDNMLNIMAVADQLNQVFLNLINNASYACGKGCTITIKTEVIGGNIIIDIKDNGRGIEPENIEHIFEPFFTTKPDLKGTGLGLSISYGIVKKHGGEIDVKSEVGKGTTFSIFLPVK